MRPVAKTLDSEFRGATTDWPNLAPAAAPPNCQHRPLCGLLNGYPGRCRNWMTSCRPSLVVCCAPDFQKGNRLIMIVCDDQIEVSILAADQQDELDAHIARHSSVVPSQPAASAVQQPSNLDLESPQSSIFSCWHLSQSQSPFDREQLSDQC